MSPTHKLVVRMDGTTGALFDLEKDPYEFKNRAGERSAAALQKDLRDKMERWGRETGDPFPKASEPAQRSYTDEEAARVIASRG